MLLQIVFISVLMAATTSAVRISGNLPTTVVSTVSEPRPREVTIITPSTDPLQVPAGGAFSLRCQGQGANPLSWSLNGQVLSTDLVNGRVISDVMDLISDRRTSLLTQAAYDGVTAVYRCHDHEDVSAKDEITVMGRETFVVDEEDNEQVCPTAGSEDPKVAFSARSSATYHISPEYQTVMLDDIHTNLGCALRVNGSVAPAIFTARVRGAYSFQVVTSAEDNDVVPTVLLRGTQEVMMTGTHGHVGMNVVLLTLDVGEVVTLKVAPASPGLLQRLTGGIFSSGAPVSQVTFAGYLLYRL